MPNRKDVRPQISQSNDTRPAATHAGSPDNGEIGEINVSEPSLPLKDVRIVIAYDGLFPWSIGGVERWYSVLAEGFVATGRLSHTSPGCNGTRLRHVVRRMFADVYVPGDSPHNAASAPLMVGRLISEHLDIVVGVRVVDAAVQDGYRRGHVTGSLIFTQVTDVLSGYREMSRRFVKSLPMFASGFDIETELCAHADRMRAPTAEVYRARHEDSASKLRTVRDGGRIALALLRLVEETRPLQFVFAIFSVLTAMSLAIGISVLCELASTGQISRLPRAVLAASIPIAAFLALLAGAVLRSVAHTRHGTAKSCTCK